MTTEFITKKEEYLNGIFKRMFNRVTYIRIKNKDYYLSLHQHSDLKKELYDRISIRLDTLYQYQSALNCWNNPVRSIDDFFRWMDSNKMKQPHGQSRIIKLINKSIWKIYKTDPSILIEILT